MTQELPPLPWPAHAIRLGDGAYREAWSADQMRAYALQAIAARADAPQAPSDTRKLCTCDGAGRGPGRACVVKAGGRLGELWRCAEGAERADAQPVAWMHPDGRVVAGSTMAGARKDGGAMLSSLAGHTIPLYAGAAPAPRQPLSAAEIKRIAETLGTRIPGQQDYQSWGMGYRQDAEGQHTIPIVPGTAELFARAIERAHGITEDTCPKT